MLRDHCDAAAGGVVGEELRVGGEDKGELRKAWRWEEMRRGREEGKGGVIACAVFCE